MKKIKELIISKDGNNIVVIVDGEKMDLKNVVSLDIHAEYGEVTITSNKVEHMDFVVGGV